MKFTILKPTDCFSRGELLLRTFFGWLYIALPHAFFLLFIGIASMFVTFIAFWAILFTGRYPQSFFDFQKNFLQWNYRVNARLLNLADGYPAFGFDQEDEYVKLEIEYPEYSDRGLVLLRALFGGLYVILPHYFILMFRYIVTNIFIFIAWWVVLFTGRYPDSMFEFNVGTLRWELRVQLYMMYLNDNYPPFSGQE